MLDESYRKAGKLDSSDFFTSLEDIIPHLLDKVTPDLLEGEDESKKLVSELYKLNVYGEHYRLLTRTRELSVGSRQRRVFQTP